MISPASLFWGWFAFLFPVYNWNSISILIVFICGLKTCLEIHGICYVNKLTIDNINNIKQGTFLRRNEKVCRLRSLLLLLLSCFSRVRLCATPETAAHQAPPSLGFSRQEHWSGLPFPSPMHESEKWKGSHSVMSNSSDPMDCSPPGFSVHGIFQARVLEWGATAFSKHATWVQ